MINTKKEEVIKIEETVESIECDCCHKTILPSDHIEWQELLNINFTGGYGSIFGDEVMLETQLCQYCVRDVLGKFLRAKSDL